MKTYFKDWINPVTDEQETIEVIEFTFEDWKQGYDLRILTLPNFYFEIPFFIKRGQKKYAYISKNEFYKIIDFRKKEYEKLVNYFFERKRDVFNISYSISPDKENLVKKEIEYLNKKFYESEAYQKIFIRGIPGRDLCNGGPLGGMPKEDEYIGIEAFVKLRNYLQSLSSIPSTTESQSNQKSKLKIGQIALKCVYDGLQITRENGNDIARQYGHNSGEKLFQRFTYFSSAANRKGKPIPCTLRKLDNKIKLIESVITLLPASKQERVRDEVLVLKTIYNTEYS